MSSSNPDLAQLGVLLQQVAERVGMNPDRLVAAPSPMLALPFVREFIRMCGIGDSLGFHERNGGNASYHLLPEEADLARAAAVNEPGPWIPIGTSVPELGGHLFLVTGSGKFMRNVPYDPEASICLAEVNPAGTDYRILWGLRDGGRPTSEFPTHLMNHEVKSRVTQGACRVIYHAHPPQLIALTYVLPLEDRAFTRALWNTMTECPVIFPEGIGVVRWMVPGGRDIAVETSKLMERYNNVVWAHHGLFCAADSFDNAMGQMETIEKAARIWMLVHAVTDKPLQGITDDGYRAIGRDFRVEIPERFL